MIYVQPNAWNCMEKYEIAYLNVWQTHASGRIRRGSYSESCVCLAIQPLRIVPGLAEFVLE